MPFKINFKSNTRDEMPRMSWTTLAATLLCTVLAAGQALAGNGGPSGTGIPQALPEPTAIALLGVGIAGLLAIRHRRNRKG